MNGIINNNDRMEWQDEKLMKYLAGELPEIRRFHEDEDLREKVDLLEEKIRKYDYFSTDKEVFINDINKSIDEIRQNEKYWNGLNVLEVENVIREQSFCLMNGEGGIGKSYFVKCLEEEVDKMNIPHLCLYGKFEKDVHNIEVDEIKKESRFFMIIDAVNEMSEKGQKELIKLLKELEVCSHIRFLVTYRTGTLKNEIETSLKELAESIISFSGVSFESALNLMIKKSVPDIYKYESILYSNNAYWLKMLCVVLSRYKITDEKIKSITSITFIIEKYIRILVKDLIGKKDGYSEADVWDDTKSIALWMYNNNKKSISATALASVVENDLLYLNIMNQLGFISEFENEFGKEYGFTIEIIYDYLIARSLFREISGKEISEQVEIIKEKIKSIENIQEPIILVLFDMFSPDFKKIKILLNNTGLNQYLRCSTLVKMIFKKNSVKEFQSHFQPTNFYDCLLVIGGFANKPFNCGNYLFKYFSKKENVLELSEALSGFRFKEGIKSRLKNLLYFTAVEVNENRRDDEIYYFALLCCSASNEDVRILAEKLLYDLISNKEKYINKLKKDYYVVSDYYIKESIIFTMSKIDKNETVKTFFNKLIENEDNISAKNVKRIATYLEDDYGFIEWKRKNVFVDDESEISDFMDKLLSHVDFMYSDYLPFKYMNKENYNIHRLFLVNEKYDIQEINRILNEKYECVKGGECEGSMVFEERALIDIKKDGIIKRMNNNAFINTYESVVNKVFSYYGIDTEPSFRMSSEEFIYSTYMKCIDIATSLLYGSLMCNYYSDEFGTFNSNQNVLGYEVYDPLEFGESIHLPSHIAIYQEDIEKMGDCAIQYIDTDYKKSREWAKNVAVTRKNVVSVLKPINYKNDEWVLLSARISIRGRKESEWKDNYNIWCCTSDKETIRNDENARYLTIEMDYYEKELKNYINSVDKPWLCKEVKAVFGNSDVLDNTVLVLPPVDLVNNLGLELNEKELLWEKNGEAVIVCNNNKASYYEDFIKSSSFIKKEYLDKFLEDNTLKYFAFTERLIPEVGHYEDETSLHFEISDGKIIKEIKNFGKTIPSKTSKNKKCENCPHPNIFKSDVNVLSDEDIKELLKTYGIEKNI